jgi:hypothetical protein
MAIFTFFDSFTTDLAAGDFATVLNADTGVINVALTNTLPVAATHTTYGAGGGAELDDLATANGYTKGGADTLNAATQTGSTISVVGTDKTWTATGAVGPFEYAFLYIGTGNQLIGFWTYPSGTVTLADTETFKTDFGATMFTVG